jgi:hypothetical protein
MEEWRTIRFLSLPLTEAAYHEGMQDWAEYGIDFTEVPQDDASIPRDVASQALARHFGQADAYAVPVAAARYGVMRINNRAQAFWEGRSEPPVWEWAVWVLTVPDARVSRGPHPVAQPQHFVISAEDGEYLFAFP